MIIATVGPCTWCIPRRFDGIAIRLTEDADYDAGETSKNVPRPRPSAGNYHDYDSRGLGIRYVQLDCFGNTTKLRKQGQTSSVHRKKTAKKVDATSPWSRQPLRIVYLPIHTLMSARFLQCRLRLSLQEDSARSNHLHHRFQMSFAELLSHDFSLSLSPSPIPLASTFLRITVWLAALDPPILTPVYVIFEDSKIGILFSLGFRTMPSYPLSHHLSLMPYKESMIHNCLCENRLFAFSTPKSRKVDSLSLKLAVPPKSTVPLSCVQVR
ncbi:unnamed protein product [Protopolystoma xenopodis]|uniref:Uncharacterized protein n=1 Tax=Protopolystoma xenopodis TaxID=117903 RepID=A0A448WU62_9PLAT|nr:unnamed protein product [Protopolystoma xenopodis]